MTTVRTAKKVLLGHELAHMLAVANVNQGEAARLLGKSAGWMGGVLNGNGQIDLGDIELLARELNVTDAGQLDALRELRRNNHRRGYWATGHNRAYSAEFRLQVDLESHADRLTSLEVEAVPGLLQCESYVRAMHAETFHPYGVTLDERIAGRVARAAVLDKAQPPLLRFVLSESCLRRVWGDDAVMREQLEHLIRLSRRPYVFLQVLPFRLPQDQRVPLTSPFVLIRVPSPGVAGPMEMAYVEGPAEFRYLDERRTLHVYEREWARLSDAALTFEQSREFLRAAAGEYSA